MYTKNLEQLLRLLQSSRQSGLLTVESVEEENTFWQGQFQLVEGNVITCLVWRKVDRQVLLKNDEAIRWLSTQGRLHWNLQESVQGPETLSPPLPLSKSIAGDGRKMVEVPGVASPPAMEYVRWVPQRTEKGVRLSTQSLKTLEYRQVFALVNGHNTVACITRLLHKSPDTIFQILKDLRNAGLVE